MNVLSLFDGISCGRQALKESGIKVNKYYASEIEESAMAISRQNHKDITYVGDVSQINVEDLDSISLLIGGSPCQSFSMAGKRKGMITTENIEVKTLEQYLNLKKDGFKFDGQSYLFWEFVRLLKEAKPKYFLLENVRMSKKWENIITEVLGVKPIRINSSKFVPQNRDRYYWTNIPNIGTPVDQETQLSDIIERAVTGAGTRGVADPNVTPNPGAKYGYTMRTTYRKDNIANTLCTTMQSTGKYITVDGAVKSLTPEHAELLQGLPVGYTKGFSKTKRFKALGNGWTVPVIKHIFKHIPV